MGSRSSAVHLPALQCLAFLVIGNDGVAAVVASCGGGGGSNANDSMLRRVVALMDRSRPIETQLSAARCVTYLYRCGVIEEGDDVILYKALPCVVRMTKKEESVEHRVLAAETLAYLIEVSNNLQRVAAISNHLITSMASFLNWADRQDNNNAMSGSGGSNNNRPPEPPSHPVSSPCSILPASLASALGGGGGGGSSSSNGNLHLPSSSVPGATSKEMRRAAFRVFASLGANDEEIRKRIIETDNLMPSLVSALDDDTSPKLQMAAVGCLHSLSRSVQLLRTTFQDHPVWRPLMKMLSSPHSSPVEPLIVASSTLCNLLLEFSPSKEPILDSGAIEMLCHLTNKYEPSLRLNGVWGLMVIQ